MNVIKKTTGLTGLAVARDPIHVLTTLYTKLLRVVGGMPSDAAYRKHTEEVVTFRALIVQKSKSPEEIEQAINCGQVEELIIQAENELRLARAFCFSKPWEPLNIEATQDQWKWPPAKTQIQ